MKNKEPFKDSEKEAPKSNSDVEQLFENIKNIKRKFSGNKRYIGGFLAAHPKRPDKRYPGYVKQNGGKVNG